MTNPKFIQQSINLSEKQSEKFCDTEATGNGGLSLISYNNIFSLDHKLKKLPSKLYKYMTLESLGLCFDAQNQTLLFAEPSTWNDPFEKVVYAASFEGFEVPRVYACCMTRQSASEASWNVYKYGGTGLKGRCAKIIIKTEHLLKELDSYAGSNGFRVYIGEAKYVKSQEIKELDHKNNLYRECLFGENFTQESFLKLLCLKREAFFYEKEIRLFLVRNGNKCRPTNGKTDKEARVPVPIKWNKVTDMIYVEKDCSDMEVEYVKLITNVRTVKKSTLYNLVRKKLKFKV